jgi:F-type H+-transporting ATPase subunit epsilon
MPFQLEIVTPEKRVLSESVDSVVLPGSEGELGILPSHIPLVTALSPGELSYSKSGKTEHFAIGTGFVEVTGERVSVLTDMALIENEIDEKTVEAALERAQARLLEIKQDSGSEEVALVMAMIQKSTAQLHLKRRRRSL